MSQARQPRRASALVEPLASLASDLEDEDMVDADIMEVDCGDGDGNGPVEGEAGRGLPDDVEPGLGDEGEPFDGVIGRASQSSERPG